jgi:hypothetical protein
MNYLHSYHTVTDTGKNQRAVNFGNSMIFGGHTKHIHKGPNKDVGKDAQYSSNHNTVA